MKITNFRLTAKINPGTSKEILYADVDVTTGWFFWKKTATRSVFKDWVHWRFMDTGKPTPSFSVEQLEHAERASRNKPKG